MSQQITRSTMGNKTRLKVLGARQELLDRLFEEARGKIGEVQGQKGEDYEGILEGLMLEGMYALGEKKVGVRCREADKGKVESAAKKASEEYKEKAGTECEVQIDEKEWLPEESYVPSLFLCRLFEPWLRRVLTTEQSRRCIHCWRTARSDRVEQHIRRAAEAM